VEFSHGSGTCLSQESKGSGTLSGSKAETNDDAASTSRSKSIQPNNLDLAFDKSNVDDTCCVEVDPSGVLLGYPNLPSHLQNSYQMHAQNY
jgi:hypothetical protein